MRGNIQLCKADICVKAEGDYAKILLGVSLLLIAIGVIIYFRKIG